jgi:ribose-phosphate pyrophosphokinase
MQILGFPESGRQAGQVATLLGVALDPVDVHHFPDGESRVRLPARLARHVVLFCTLDRPNSKLIELLLAASAARDRGVRHITLVAPYLCYMRQDKAFHAGEVVSQRVIGRFLADCVDRLVTVDPHLHRVATLGEAVPADEAVSLSAAPLIGRFLAARSGRPLLLGPDEESVQWVSVAADAGQLEFGVGRKQRRGDREVRIVLPDMPYDGRAVVIVDDVAATGRTLATAARQVLARGARSVAVLVTHPVFAGDGEAHLRAAGVTAVWSTDSIAHPTNVISLAPLLAEALRAELPTPGD